MYVFNNKMPATYYGLVRQIGPYKQTALDKKHLNEKQPLFVGGGVWAGGSTHAGHGEWLMVNDIHGNYEGKQKLGFEKASDYNTPSVVVPRRQDLLATLSPDQRQAYYHEGMFQKRSPLVPPPEIPSEASPDITVNPIVLPSGEQVQELPLPASLPDLTMESAPSLSLPDPDFMNLDFDELGFEGRRVPETTEQSTMTLLPDTVRNDVSAQLVTNAPSVLQEETLNNVRYVTAEPGAEIAPRQGPTVVWTPAQLEQYREIGLPAERRDSAATDMNRPAKRKGTAAADAAITKKAKKNVKETLAQATKRKAFVKPLKEKQVTVKKPVLGTQEAGPSKTEEQMVKVPARKKPSRKGKEPVAGVTKKASPALKKAGLRKKLDSVNRRLKAAQNRLKVLQGKQSGRTPSELKTIQTQIKKQELKIAALQKEKNGLLSELNKI